MKNLFVLIALFLFIGLNTVNAQDETGAKKEYNKTKINHPCMNHQMEHSQMNHDMDSSQMNPETKHSKMNQEMNYSHMNHEMNHVSAEPWNEVCPVRGGEVDKNVAAVEYNEKYYGFCCGGCDAKFEKDPERYLRNLSEDGKKFIGKKS